MNFTKEIKGHCLEFIDDEHIYLVDGIEVPSVSQILEAKFGDVYKGVPEGILKNAAQEGTFVHEAIEIYCTTGLQTPIKEVQNFRFLQDRYKFEVLENEVPVILFEDGEPIAAGRLDMVIRMNNEIGGVDIKRVSTLNRNKTATQLNLYRIMYEQCYGIKWRFLRALHLKEDVRRFVELPVNEFCAWDAVKAYKEKHESI